MKKVIKPKIKYDKDSQVLSFEFSNNPSVDSDIRENAIIDYGRSGEIISINFYKFNFNNFRRLVKPIRALPQVARSMGIEVVG